MERDWTLEQKQRLRKKIEAMVDKRARKSQYKDILLKRCKNHDGPTSSSEDVVSRIGDDEKLKTCLRAEIGLQKALHPFDAQERPHLYKMNFLTADEILLQKIKIADKSFDQDEVSVEEKKVFNVNEPVAVVWDNDKGER